MKKSKYLLIGLLILVLAILVLAGCGVSKSDYESLQVENATLEAEKATLQAEKQTIQNDYDILTTEHEALQSERNTLEAEKQNLKTDYDDLNTEHENLLTELNTLQDEKDSLQADYNVVNSELTEIKEVYPPRDFSSRRELEDWLIKNDVSEKPDVTDAESWLSRALEIHDDALLDGYIIFVDYDYDVADDTYAVFCTTLINGYFWYWDPETDEISQDISLLPIE
jgi:outer membrane murein-binding lipoprotein Lpp